MCVAERYVYLPAIGLMLSLAYVISLLPAPYNYVLATAFLSFYATKLWIHTPAYKDERALAFRNHFDFPDFYYPYSWIGMFYKDQGRRYEALGWWTDALDRRPLDFKVLFNLSHMMGELGYLKEANELLEKVKKSLIPNGLEKNLLAMIENRQKHVRAAIEQSQIATQNQIIELAKNIKKGEQLK
jgi:tetratricopeptide (TPR) repeat protein